MNRTDPTGLDEEFPIDNPPASLVAYLNQKFGEKKAGQLLSEEGWQPYPGLADQAPEGKRCRWIRHEWGCDFVPGSRKKAFEHTGLTARLAAELSAEGAVTWKVVAEAGLKTTVGTPFGGIIGSDVKAEFGIKTSVEASVKLALKAGITVFYTFNYFDNFESWDEKCVVDYKRECLKYTEHFYYERCPRTGEKIKKLGYTSYGFERDQEFQVSEIIERKRALGQGQWIMKKEKPPESK